MVIGWKAWYADGSVYVGKSREDWAALPDDGVLVVMLYHDELVESYARPEFEGQRSRRIMSGNDCYWISDGPADHIYGQADASPEQVRERYPGALVKTGRFTDDDTFKRVQEEAMADHDYSGF